MEAWNYRALSREEIREVLERAGRCRLALAQEAQPYLLPMHFRVQWQGEMPVVRLRSPAYGMKMQFLEANRRVALEFEAPAEGALDSVMAFGFARFGGPRAGEEEGISIRVEVFQITGRRFFERETFAGAGARQLPGAP